MREHDKRICFSSQTDEYETPQIIFDQLNEKWHFTLDVCATINNAKCDNFFTKEQNGLRHSWKNQTCWMNPPYGRDIKYWISKAYLELINNGTSTIALLPARTDTKWFHDYIYSKGIKFDLLRGRLKFNNHTQNAPFPSMIVEFVK